MCNANRTRDILIKSQVIFQLSYRHVFQQDIPGRGYQNILLEKQITGIGPAPSAWEADVLPLDYICIFGLDIFSASTGFEPDLTVSSACFQLHYLGILRYHAEADDGNRTRISSLEGLRSSIEPHPHTGHSGPVGTNYVQIALLFITKRLTCGDSDPGHAAYKAVALTTELQVIMQLDAPNCCILYQVAYATASVTLRLNLSVFTKRLYF